MELAASSSPQGWLTPEETAFLENTLTDPKLYQYLYTRDPIKLRYPPRFQGDYQQFATDSAQQFQRAHQTMRRLMHKSPYSLQGGQRAYTIIKDESLPLADLNVGSRITLGYRLLLLRPKYDIGKHMTLAELVFPDTMSPVKILPVGSTYYIMDEDHIFMIEGFERRPLREHPSHGPGAMSYHIDLIRLVCTRDVRVPTRDELESEESSRIHVTLDADEKPNLLLRESNWRSGNEDLSTASTLLENAHGSQQQGRDVKLADLENFKRSLSARFSDETLIALYRVSTRNRNVITKLLFEVHTHILKLSHIVTVFTMDRPVDTRYTDLETRLTNAVNGIAKELDAYFANQSALSSANSTVYLVISSKHLENLNRIGSMVLFDNFIVGYTSTDSLAERIAVRPSYAVMALHLPPRMPVLILPEHTGISKYHKAIVLPRQAVFQVEEIRSVPVISDPLTYRKVFMMRYRRTDKPRTTGLNMDHLVELEPAMLKDIRRDSP